MRNLIFLSLIFTVSCGSTVERTVLPQPTTKTEEPKIEKSETKIEKTKIEKKQKKLKKEVSDTLKEYGYEK